MEQENIPYTLHWGKYNINLSPDRVRKMYGDNSVDKWISSRRKLLDAKTRRVFNNAFMYRCGLDF